MGTINHLYDPNQEVYTISKCEKDYFVKKGTVVRVQIAALLTATTIRYDIRLDNESGTTEFEESDVFVDKTAALSDYDTRIN